jgi:uncharacterized damage-inducible protein DinB
MAQPEAAAARAQTARIGGMLDRRVTQELLAMRLMRFVCSCAVVLAAASPALAQNPGTAAVKGQFGMISGVLARTAEKIPENLYAFKATPEVRSIAQLIGHIADSHFGMCAAAAGEKPAQSGIEKSMTTKAALSKALADSSAYCNKVIDAMTDQKGMGTIKFFTGETPRLMVLTFNIAHSYEHYGNLVTYMRLNKIVPPSSEKSGMN